MALEIARILVQHFGIVIAFVHQVAQLLIQVVEEHRVLVDVLQEVLTCRTTIGLELDVPVRVVQVQHRVKRVVVQPRFVVIRHACIGGFVAACSRHVLSLHQSWATRGPLRPHPPFPSCPIGPVRPYSVMAPAWHVRPCGCAHDGPTFRQARPHPDWPRIAPGLHALVPHPARCQPARSGTAPARRTCRRSPDRRVQTSCRNCGCHWQ